MPLVNLERLVNRVNQVNRETEGRKACKVRQESQAPQELKVKLGRQVIKVNLVKKEYKVLREV